MTIAGELAKFKTIFIDTSPIIYYIEAHPDFGPLTKPIESGNESLAKQFSEFLKAGNNLTLLEISADIAELAGKLRGQYPSLRSMDAIQIAVSLIAETDLFITNDVKLKQIKEIRTVVLKDYL